MAAGRSDTAANGRYVQGGQTVSLTNRIGWWERKLMPRDISDVPFIITPKYHKRPDVVAFDVYGTAQLMWLVLQYNNILDINEEFVEGSSIILPTKSRVLTELTQRLEPLTS